MWNKQISQAAIIVLDQTVILKRKFSRPKISAEKFIHPKEASGQRKRDLFMFEINVKQPLQQFYVIQRSEQGVEGEEHQGFAAGGDEHRRTRRSTNADLRKRKNGTYGCGRAAEVCR